MMRIEMETERLTLREFTIEDVPAVQRYASDPLVVRYMIWGPNRLEETEQFVAQAIAMQGQNPRRDYEVAVVLKSSGELIGGCGLHCSDPAQGEIGYCFHPDYWRQGYGAEAALALLDLGFGRLGLHRISATCRPDNEGSAGVMKKVGMTYEGRLRGHMYHKGAWHDSDQYSILEDEYRARTSVV
ncbi:GNAT family N-acetyltransferase [Paenibacillus sp. 598K]|uniref:GNAT family N-acetyltransferase n=1 Tax=Paenibacillus sp. 598K TaxID=1117987 RepID=UPI000FFF2CB7|nr:GNAT family protein [Paenibacillus sp. 598K]